MCHKHLEVLYNYNVRYLMFYALFRVVSRFEG